MWHAIYVWHLVLFSWRHYNVIKMGSKIETRGNPISMHFLRCEKKTFNFESMVFLVSILSDPFSRAIYYIISALVKLKAKCVRDNVAKWFLYTHQKKKKKEETKNKTDRKEKFFDRILSIFDVAHILSFKRCEHSKFVSRLFFKDNFLFNIHCT